MLIVPGIWTQYPEALSLSERTSVSAVLPGKDMEREFLSEHSVSYNINKITVKYFLQAESPLACFLGLVMWREHTKLSKILVGFLMRTLGRQTDGRRVVTFPLRRCFTSLAAYPL